VKAQESPSAHSLDANGRYTPLNPSTSSPIADGRAAGLASNSRLNGTSPHAVHPSTDDSESLAGDTLNAGGSASSHTSSTSSVFSAPTRLSASAAMRKPHALTPPTTIASPSSYLSTAAPTKAQSTTTRRDDYGTDSLLPIADGSVQDAAAVERVPCRDPSRSIKCIKRTYEPLLDPSLSSSEKKKAKPVYKEFGLVRTP
jgi:[histone H3]-lysine4 N-trimethyltransferase SETD1